MRKIRNKQAMEVTNAKTEKRFVFDFGHDGAVDRGYYIQRTVDAAHKQIDLYRYDLVLFPQCRSRECQYMTRYVYRFNQPRLRNFDVVLAKPMDEELSAMIRQKNVLVIDDFITSDSTINDVLRTLRMVSNDNDITIFSLIGRKDLMADS